MHFESCRNTPPKILHICTPAFATVPACTAQQCLLPPRPPLPPPERCQVGTHFPPPPPSPYHFMGCTCMKIHTCTSTCIKDVLCEAGPLMLLLMCSCRESGHRCELSCARAPSSHCARYSCQYDVACTSTDSCCCVSLVQLYVVAPSLRSMLGSGMWAALPPVLA